MVLDPCGFEPTGRGPNRFRPFMDLDFVDWDLKDFEPHGPGPYMDLESVSCDLMDWDPI